MKIGSLVLYDGKTAVVVSDGAQCSAEAEGDLDDHLGLWLGEFAADGRPIVYTIPAEYVEASPALEPRFLH